MVERKLYKTRLCDLYQKGRCPRQTCSFAHGDAELRGFNTSSSFNGRHNYRDGDLREKIGRRRSPPHRNSLGKDARDRHPPRGYRSPRSGKKSDWSHRKRQRFDGESDFSGSLRMSDGPEDQARDKNPSSSGFKNVHGEQLEELKSEINMLEDHKRQLEIYLEERAQEADSLNSKIKELEMQLSTEKEECERITSKIRKFVRAHTRHSKIQDELKRSQARLLKLGDRLGSDIKSVTNEEDININILSEEETLGNYLMSPRMQQHKDASPSKKRVRVEANEGSMQEILTKGEGLNTGKTIPEKHARWDAYHAQFNRSNEMQYEANRTSNGRSSVNNSKPSQGRSMFTSMPSMDKLKDSKSSPALPMTGMAAHAVDGLVEVVELDEKLEAEEIDSAKGEKGSALEFTGLQVSLPPPPPLPPARQNAYLEYKGKDEEVDVDGVDDEMLDVDIV